MINVNQYSQPKSGGKYFKIKNTGQFTAINYLNLQEIMKEHYKKETIKIVEHYKFFKSSARTGDAR